jgi:hypothetical protein
MTGDRAGFPFITHSHIAIPNPSRTAGIVRNADCRSPHPRRCALTPASAAAHAELRYAPTLHGPRCPPWLRRRSRACRRAAPISTPTTHFARSVLVEDDRDVNLRKRGRDGNIGQFPQRCVPRRGEVPQRTGSTAIAHAPVFRGTASSPRRSFGRSLLRRIPLREKAGEVIAEVISADRRFQPLRRSRGRQVLDDRRRKSSLFAASRARTRRTGRPPQCGAAALPPPRIGPIATTGRQARPAAVTTASAGTEPACSLRPASSHSRIRRAVPRPSPGGLLGSRKGRVLSGEGRVSM